MANQQSKRKKKVLSPKLYKLLRKIGSTFKVLRKNQGFSSSISFAIAKNINESTYGKYEAGSENMTIESLLETAELLGLTEDDIFSKEFLTLGMEPNLLSKKSQVHLINEVRHQVELLVGSKKANEFDDDDIERMYLIMISGIDQVSKTQILKKVKLRSTTPNFEDVLDFLLRSKWISMTHPETPTRPDQKYYTSKIGKKVLRMESE